MPRASTPTIDFESPDLGSSRVKMNTHSRIEQLRIQIASQEAKLAALNEELSALEIQVNHDSTPNGNTIAESESSSIRSWPLLAKEYTRYGRQMILPEIGLPGQLRLRAAKVLIIGLGGLGCPAAVYLAGAGVGTLGLVDGDVVELSNLHRQILHSTTKVGMKKVDSAEMALKSINSHPKYVTYPEHLNPATALDIFLSYDVILDCTDAPQTRYLISDAAVLCGKPFVSASALKTDGQLMVLNYPPAPRPQDRQGVASGPCYRCIFPRPPPPESVVTCGEGGILGPVVGVMGVLMALEAIKLIYSGALKLSKDGSLPSPLLSSHLQESRQHSMMMLTGSGLGLSIFRNIRLKGKREDCVACGSNATINAEHSRSGSLDYAVFCGAASPVSILGKEERIAVKELSRLLNDTECSTSQEHTQPNGDHPAGVNSSPPSPSGTPIIIDVRDEAQFSICALPHSINIPWNILQSHRNTHDGSDPLSELRSQLMRNPRAELYTICRLGNDSQMAVRRLQELNLGQKLVIKDVLGGFKAWKQDVDKDWPEY